MHATYFDGTTARAHAVQLSIEDGRLVIRGEDLDRRDPLGAVDFGDTLGSSRRIIRLNGGASCEVTDVAGLTELLSAHGLSSSRVSQWETSGRWAAGALIGVVLLGILAYQFGLPLLARSAADRLPESALESLSNQIARVLDSSVFSPSSLPETRMHAISSRFAALELPPGSAIGLDIVFRSAGAIGANAMALPSGRVFVTDELVALTPDDRMILAVIAHEAGHVKGRHGLRNIIQSSLVGILVTWYLGDVSALGAAAPAAVLNAKYSRDLEREADAYAVQVLRLNNMPVSLLADALDLIDEAHGNRPSNSSALAYLSSHPATSERLTWIRQQ